MMYLAGGTQADIAYAVNLLARYSTNSSESHWTALDYLVGYIKGTVGMKIRYTGEKDSLDLWTDANWGGEHERLMSGYVIKMNGDSVAWGAKRQTVVALSTCAAKSIALSEGAQNLAAISIMLEDIQQSVKMNILCNNETTILIAGDNASKKKTRYLIQAFYFINDFVRANNIDITWTSTINQQADIFTKELGPNKMDEAVKKLGLRASPTVPGLLRLGLAALSHMSQGNTPVYSSLAADSPRVATRHAMLLHHRRAPPAKKKWRSSSFAFLKMMMKLSWQFKSTPTLSTSPSRIIGEDP
jgi:hypothetical protein